VLCYQANTQPEAPIGGKVVNHAADAAAPKFEVASIKPCVKGEGRGFARPPSPGSLALKCQSVMDLVRTAYVSFAKGLEHHEPANLTSISGGPDWVDSDLYNIDAKAEGPQPLRIIMGPMLQALLEDRFQLKVRRETRLVSALALTVAKGGPKQLTPSAEGGCVPFDAFQPTPKLAPGQHRCGFFSPDPNGGFLTYGQTMAGLCEQLSFTLDEVVIDQTRISGAFDFHIQLNVVAPRPRSAQPQDDSNAPSDPADSIFGSVQRLGLKLESIKTPRESIVIEHLERPSVN
jgi:uncharacterized protein (TIGR03435 family)